MIGKRGGKKSVENTELVIEMREEKYKLDLAGLDPCQCFLFFIRTEVKLAVTIGH